MVTGNFAMLAGVDPPRVYRAWDRMAPEKQSAYRDSAARVLAALR